MPRSRKPKPQRWSCYYGLNAWVLSKFRDTPLAWCTCRAHAEWYVRRLNERDRLREQVRRLKESATDGRRYGSHELAELAARRRSGA